MDAGFLALFAFVVIVTLGMSLKNRIGEEEEDWGRLDLPTLLRYQGHFLFVLLLFGLIGWAIWEGK